MVAIVGAGNVGSNLGRNLLKAGAQVVYGARDPTSPKTLASIEQLPGAKAMSIPDAVSWSNVVILAIPGMRTQEAYDALASSLGSGIEGKVVLDATNPLSAFPALEVLYENTSGGEMCAKALPSSFVFKAFNTIGAEHMGTPDGSLIPGSVGPLTMLFAGDASKKDIAASVVSAVGFAPRYVGPIRYARNLESVAELWIHLAVPPAGFTQESWGRNFHFQVADSASGSKPEL